MLTSNLVRVRHHKDRVKPWFLDAGDPSWRQWAETLLVLYRGAVGRSRGELEEEIAETFGGLPNPQVHQGLAKLLEDRCDFEVVSGHPPDEVREAMFRAASERRQSGKPFVRAEVVQRVATRLGLGPEIIEQSLFADLKIAQQVTRFDDLTAERLLDRYNVALCQGILLRAIQVGATVRGATPARFRQLFRKVKFHRLICEVKPAGPNAYQLRLDGPLSLFSATQKYGVQLANFLPALLLCKPFELRAELRWGPRRDPKIFELTSEDGLVSHQQDTGTYLPPELAMFVDLFRKKISAWELHEEPDIVPLKDGFWVPDFRLMHKASGKNLFLEVLGFWRRSSLETHLARLKSQVTTPFLLAVSDQLNVDEEDLKGLPAGLVRFRQMPIPEEIVKQAEITLESI